MVTKTRKKTFDCVQMMHRAQQEILAEYEARKSEFSSYEEFLHASIRESPWTAKILGKLHGAKGKKG